jgi:hypothetical protein
MKKPVFDSQESFNEWLKVVRQKYGDDMLAWPVTVRRKVASARVRKPKTRSRQLVFDPCCNTGVKNGL